MLSESSMWGVKAEQGKQTKAVGSPPPIIYFIVIRKVVHEHIRFLLFSFRKSQSNRKKLSFTFVQCTQVAMIESRFSRQDFWNRTHISIGNRPTRTYVRPRPARPRGRTNCELEWRDYRVFSFSLYLSTLCYVWYVDVNHKRFACLTGQPSHVFISCTSHKFRKPAAITAARTVFQRLCSKRNDRQSKK